MGDLMRSHNQPSKAIQCYSDGLLLPDKDPLAYVGLGYCWIALSKYQSAIAAFERALAIRKDIPMAYFGLAISHRDLGDDLRAAQLFEDFKQHDKFHVINKDLAIKYAGKAEIELYKSMYLAQSP